MKSHVRGLLLCRNSAKQLLHRVFYIQSLLPSPELAATRACRHHLHASMPSCLLPSRPPYLPPSRPPYLPLSRPPYLPLSRPPYLHASIPSRFHTFTLPYLHASIPSRFHTFHASI